MTQKLNAAGDTQAFATAYAGLNAAQKKAVDAIEGPVMVIAGPGTGKTQILTLRIANILLQTDTAPSSILALTFTEAGAKAMRERLRRYIGARAYQVPIYTFHGFAEKLIKDYPDAYGRIIGGRPASSLEKITILESIIDTSGVKVLRPAGDPSYYVTHLQHILSDLKKEYVAPDDLAALVSRQEQELSSMEQFHQKGAHKGKVKGDYSKKEKAIEKNRELVVIYRQYEAMLRSLRLYDFEDMITETVKALDTNEDMLRDLQEQYQYLLADEHQDVNGSQNRILASLAAFHDAPNIFVVGDEKQAIYRFQGASLQNFLYFTEQFPGTTVIHLTENYRSGQVILDAAHSLVQVESGPLHDLRVPLTAAAVNESRVTRRTFSHQSVEDEWLVADVKAQVAAGVPPEEIAVIVRTNREVEAYAMLLRRSGVAVEASADGDILEHTITHTIEGLLQAVVGERDEEGLFTLLHGAYWGLAARDVIRIVRARTYTTPLSELLYSEVLLRDLGVENVAGALRIGQVIATARDKSVTEPPHRVLEFLITESGLLSYVTQQDPFEGVRVIRRLYDEVEAVVLANQVQDLRAVIAMFTQTRNYKLALGAPYITTNLKSVQVMTAHKSKGLEFAVVYVPHLQDSIWGGGSKKTYFDIPLGLGTLPDDVIDDEKRLLYVAMTRAKGTLNFSGSEVNAAGKVLVPTRFFDTIDADTVVVESVESVETNFNPAALFQQRLSPQPLDTAFLKHALSTKGFSATSFNNYLTNPWDYVYLNVLQIPRVQETHLQFGTAIHAVLEYATKLYTATGALPSVTHVKTRLEQALGRLPLSPVEFSRLHERGLEVLVPYLAHMTPTLPVRTLEEFKVSVVLPTGIPELPELPLTGNLDRLDFDASGQVVRVVDYKTGKPKTRNAIEGLTASDDGAYKRQLVFYALLLELYGDTGYQTRTGVLSFVQADTKGVIHEEEFTITDTDIADLKAQLIGAVAGLLAGDFITDPTLREESLYRALATALGALDQ